MHVRILITAALWSLATPLAVQAVNLNFLKQAPIRYFNDRDIALMSNASDKALDEANEGEVVEWSNAQTGSSGTITPVRSFTHQGNNCRRLRVVNQARQATPETATSNIDFCKVEGSWKFLTVAP